MKNSKDNDVDVTIRFNNIKLKAKMGKKPIVIIKDMKNDKKYKVNLYKIKKFKRMIKK